MKKRYIVQRPDELRGAYPPAILALTQAMVCKLQKTNDAYGKPNDCTRADGRIITPREIPVKLVAGASRYFSLAKGLPHGYEQVLAHLRERLSGASATDA